MTKGNKKDASPWKVRKNLLKILESSKVANVVA
jgi:hypothetical protein